MHFQLVGPHAITALLLLLPIPGVLSKCYDPSPAFQVPTWSSGAKPLNHALKSIEKQLSELMTDSKWNTSSYSIELTSNTETLWTSYHTASIRNESRPGAKEVDGDTFYRIASISKTFTTLAILQQAKAGNLSLDDPVKQYIPELAGDDAGAIPWKDITLRMMASQLSGIPRESGQSDLWSSISRQVELGLPPIDERDVPPTCSEFRDFSRPCTRKDLIESVTHSLPLFAPNFKSTYSNVNFELLGLVIANVTGMSYEDYVQEHIFELVGMESGASFKTPEESQAVIPAGPEYDSGPDYWDIDLGVLIPTGGIYATSSAMLKYLRYILTHYNALATGVNWFLPQSFSGSSTYYGMPWEIYRQRISAKGNERPVTMVTKSGILPGYSSRIDLLPEYGLGIVFFIGGIYQLLPELEEIVYGTLIPAVERNIWYDVDEQYTGTYKYESSENGDGLNTSLTLTTSLQSGLQLNSFISNSTDVAMNLRSLLNRDGTSQSMHLQLIPTLLYINETSQQGERWRVKVVHERDENSRGIFDDFCLSDDDMFTYAGAPFNEVIFWRESEEIELPAWRVKLKKVSGPVSREEDVRFTVQDHREDL